MLLGTALRARGHTVDAVADGVEALDLAHRSRPDLIVSDILMPNMDGFTLCRALKRDPVLRQVPLVFYTATFVDEQDELLALAMGASRFVPKPMETDAFLRIIDEVLREYREESLPAYARPHLESGALQHLYEQSLLRKLDEKVHQLEQQRKALWHSNRAWRTLSECNAAVAREASENELLRKVCEIVVATGAYPLAWVGYAERDEAQTVRPVAQAGIGADCLAQVRIGWGHDALGQGPVGRAIATGMSVLVPDLDSDPSFAPWRAAAARHGFGSLVALPLLVGGCTVGALVVYARQRDAFDPAELRLLRELAEDLAYGVQSRRAEAARQQAAERLTKALVQTVQAVALTIEKRDPYTAGHQQRVAALASAIATALGFSDERVEGLRLGSLIHDIGKIYIPAEILNRPGQLSATEFDLVKTHVEVGYEIIKDVDLGWPVAQMVVQHHERLDGSGYPRGLRGDEIIPEARVLAVADVVEAMTSHRPYREELGLEAALREIGRGRGSRYDPLVVDACVALFREQGFRLPG